MPEKENEILPLFRFLATDLVSSFGVKIFLGERGQTGDDRETVGGTKGMSEEGNQGL